MTLSCHRDEHILQCGFAGVNAFHFQTCLCQRFLKHSLLQLPFNDRADMVAGQADTQHAWRFAERN